MTSLDMAGISVTLLALPAGAEGDDLLALLDAPTGSRAWPGGPAQPPRLLVVPRPAAEHGAVADAGNTIPRWRRPSKRPAGLCWPRKPS